MGRNVRIELGGVGVDAEGGEENLPSNGAREAVVFLELTLRGGVQVACLHQRVGVSRQTGLLGDGFEEVGGLGFGWRGFCESGHGEHGEAKTEKQYKGKGARGFVGLKGAGATDGFESFHVLLLSSCGRNGTVRGLWGSFAVFWFDAFEVLCL